MIDSPRATVEVLQPTYQLRWCIRQSVIQDEGATATRMVQTLQQAFVSMAGKIEWRDIPTVRE